MLQKQEKNIFVSSNWNQQNIVMANNKDVFE